MKKLAFRAYFALALAAVLSLGAVVFSIIGYIYVKTRGKGRFAKRFIPVLEEDEEQSASSEDVLPEKAE